MRIGSSIQQLYTKERSDNIKDFKQDGTLTITSAHLVMFKMFLFKFFRKHL